MHRQREPIGGGRDREAVMCRIAAEHEKTYFANKIKWIKRKKRKILVEIPLVVRTKGMKPRFYKKTKEAKN